MSQEFDSTYDVLGYFPTNDHKPLTPAQYIEQAHEDVKRFFGKDRAVPPVHSKMFEARQRAEDLGLSVELIYIPPKLFDREEEFPGWTVKPEEDFWKKVPTTTPYYEEFYPNMRLSHLKGSHALIDTSVRPDFDEGRQHYGNDALERFVAMARGIDDETYEITRGSRFGLPLRNQDDLLFPMLTNELGLNQAPGVRVRRPTFMEFNYTGNLRYPHFGQSDTFEWFDDIYFDYQDIGWRETHPVAVPQHLLGGSSRLGGLAHVEGIGTAVLPHGWRVRERVIQQSTAFRFVVAFPPVE